MPAPPLPSGVPRALHLLLQASGYARQLGRPLWEFAVEVDCLRALGLTNSDLRWLLCRGYVAQALERTRPRAQRRTFTRVANLAMHGTSCFVLTPDGIALAGLTSAEEVPGRTGSPLPGGAEGATPPEVPHWDAQLHELRYRGRLVKQFKQPARSQERVLSAFEEDGWPSRIDDPLTWDATQDPKRRLHETITNLNRHQAHCLIRFMGDGTGEGVRWRPLPSRYSRATAQRL